MQHSFSRTHRHASMAAHAPIGGAVKYIHRCSKCPETSAGASERAGFMEAPQIGPANIASNAMTAPTAMPAVMPFSFAPVETFKIVSIRKNVKTISRMNDCKSEPAGNVAPSK